MARPSAAERRQDYLEIGAEIASEFDASAASGATVEALANVKISEVASRAGVSKGSVYHLWPSQEAYRRDLLQRLLAHSRQAGIRELSALLADRDTFAEDPRREFREFAEFAFEALKDDPAFFARFSFFIYASNPHVNELLAQGEEEVVAEFAPFVERYLELLGRRLRPPFTISLLMTSTHALFQGLCLRYRTSPELVRTEMFASGMQALVEHFSEPVPSADVDLDA